MTRSWGPFGGALSRPHSVELRRVGDVRADFRLRCELCGETYQLRRHAVAGIRQRQCRSGCRKPCGCWLLGSWATGRTHPAVSHRELTTVLTTTMTTVGLPDTSTYTTIELASSLVAPSACAYGSEGWGFESLRAHLRAHALPADMGSQPGRHARKL